MSSAYKKFTVSVQLIITIELLESPLLTRYPAFEKIKYENMGSPNEVPEEKHSWHGNICHYKLYDKIMMDFKACLAKFCIPGACYTLLKRE